MFDPALAVEVISAAPAVPDLGPQNQILQLFGGIIALLVFAIGALSWLRGERAPAAPPAQPAPASGSSGAQEGVHLYFDGPLKDIYGRLQKLDTVLDAITALAAGVSKNKTLHHESRELLATALQATRHDIKNALHADVLEQSRELDDLKRLIGEVHELTVRIEVRLDEFTRHQRG